MIKNLFGAFELHFGANMIMLIKRIVECICHTIQCKVYICHTCLHTLLNDTGYWTREYPDMCIYDILFTLIDCMKYNIYIIELSKMYCYLNIFL